MKRARFLINDHDIAQLRKETDQYVKDLNESTEQLLKEARKVSDDLMKFYQTGDTKHVEYLGVTSTKKPARTGRCGNPVVPLA